MSKRFYIEANGIWDVEQDNLKLTWGDLCDVLNELADENEFYQSENDIFKLVHELRKENRELRNRLKQINYFLGRLKENHDELEELLLERRDFS